MTQPVGSITFLKLIGAMFMWGGTWIAGRIVAQELTAPLAAPATRFLLAGFVLGGVALITEGRIPRPQTGSEWGIVSGLAMTGIFLTFYYVPSPERAYSSVYYISHYVNYGWLIRSVHAWGAQLIQPGLLELLPAVGLAQANAHLTASHAAAKYAPASAHSTSHTPSGR